MVAEVKGKDYKDWNDYDSEDPASYQGEILLLGTITHEDHVIMLLDEFSKEHFISQGIDFSCEWKF